MLYFGGAGLIERRSVPASARTTLSFIGNLSRASALDLRHAAAMDPSVLVCSGALAIIEPIAIKHSRAGFGGDPVAFLQKTLDSRIRGNDDVGQSRGLRSVRHGPTADLKTTTP